MRQLTLDRYVIDTLMPDLVGHDRRPSSFLVYLFLWASADGSRTRTASASQRAIAEGTGLSKRAVQDALAQLERRRLVLAVGIEQLAPHQHGREGPPTMGRPQPAPAPPLSGNASVRLLAAGAKPQGSGKAG